MTDDEVMADYARRLFAEQPDPNPETPAPDPAKGNHVPREGHNPTTPANDMHTFTAALFERALTD